jgi:hypothetical protein
MDNFKGVFTIVGPPHERRGRLGRPLALVEVGRQRRFQLRQIAEPEASAAVAMQNNGKRLIT